MDANTDIYLWMGWWPVQKNKLLQEKNAFSGLAQSRWAKDKKLALETALMYAEGRLHLCGYTVHIHVRSDFSNVTHPTIH